MEGAGGTPDPGAPHVGREARPATAGFRRPAFAWTAGVVAVLLASLAFASDRFTRAARAEAREDVREQLAAHGYALTEALARRATLLYGLRAWTSEHPGLPPGPFRSFAEDLTAGVTGVRAVQVVRGSIVVASWPPEGNEGVVGLDLRTHPDPRVRDDLARALTRGGEVVSGPVELVQGGTGIVLRLAAGSPGDTGQVSVSVIVDLAPALRAAGIEDGRAGGLHLHLLDARGASVVGSAARVGEDPVRFPLPVPDGRWQLQGAPVEGWGTAAGRERRILWGGGLLLVLAVGALSWGVASRQASLRAAVEERTRALAATARRLEEEEVRMMSALRAGRVYAWSWDLSSGRVMRSEDLGDILGLETGPLETLDALLDRVHAHDRAQLESAIALARRSGHLSVEYRLRHPERRWVWVRDEGRAVEWDDGGSIRRMVGATADVTRVKELEHQLLRSQKLEEVGRLAAVIAHDFNNLLTVMRVSLELGLEELGGPPSEDFRQIGQALEHAEVLTRKLLSFTRQDVVNPEVLVFDAALEAAVEMVRPILGSGVELTFEPGAGEACVHMDRGWVTQILFNLAVNARDAMPRGGVVTVRSAVDVGRGEVRLVVEDTGSGIREGALERIFEPFVTTKAPGKGTGLGLSTVRTIVSGMGGRVGAENHPRGARFIVTLPVDVPA